MTRKLLEYRNFNTAQGKLYRDNVDKALVAMNALRVDGNPFDDIRKNAPLLIQEIEKARASVDKANRDVSEAQQKITDRKKEMIQPTKKQGDKDAILAVAGDKDALQAKIAKLNKSIDDLNSGAQVTTNIQKRIAEEKQWLAMDEERLEKAKQKIKPAEVDREKANARLKEIQAYEAIHHPLEVARKLADEAVIGLKGQLGKQKEDIASSKKDFDDIEKDLADFDARKKEQIAEIRTQAQAGAAEKATARQRYEKLVATVKAKNDESIPKLQAVSGLLEPHGKCYADLEDVLKRIKARLTALAAADPDLDQLGKMFAIAIAITAPPDGSKSQKPDITITGTVIDPAVTEVTLNIGGKQVLAAVKGGQFSAAATLAQGQNVIQASVGSSQSNPVTVTLGDASPWDGTWRGTIRGVSISDGVRKNHESNGEMQVSQSGNIVTLKTGKNNLKLTIDPDSPNNASLIDIQTLNTTPTTRDGRSKRTTTATLRDGHIHLKVVFEMIFYVRSDPQSPWKEKESKGESNGDFERVK